MVWHGMVLYGIVWYGTIWLLYLLVILLFTGDLEDGLLNIAVCAGCHAGDMATDFVAVTAVVDRVLVLGIMTYKYKIRYIN